MAAPAFELASGAEGRWTGTPHGAAVVCVNGGTAARVPGTWSASLEWLVGAVAPRFPRLGFVEVRYRVKSWHRLDLCVADGAAAVDAAREAGAERIVLLGFSMGGAVATSNAAAPEVEAVVGVNPWLPPQLDLAPLRGRRLAIVHGTLDAPLPGIPGVKPAQSAAAAARAAAAGVEVERELVRGGLHAVALRRRSGDGVLVLPGATRYRDFVVRELERFCA
ncbi:MAG TPA: dienelactone hydrolase family protein [Gaiellaceae bacterium]|nr:dienelactone hydrolase family protein [Gaiellaceae bacterium]